MMQVKQFAGRSRRGERHDFPDHFGFFLPLARISTVKQIRESAFDVRATGRLNKLYIGVETSPVDVRDASEIERAIVDFAGKPNGGLIVTASPAAIVNRKLIINMAANHRLPAVYFQKGSVEDGGLISYGPDPVALYRQAASYIDRILNGEKPATLPVQAPTKFELAINLKTAKALGLTVPPSLLARADEVIE